MVSACEPDGVWVVRQGPWGLLPDHYRTSIKRDKQSHYVIFQCVPLPTSTPLR